MAVSVVLAGAENDMDVLKSAVRFAAREGCDVRVVLAESYPGASFLEELDSALWEAARLGLPAPRVCVERSRRQREQRIPPGA